MTYVLIIIVKTHCYLLLLLVLSALIEYSTRFKLLVRMFLWKKNEYAAGGASDFHAVLYFIFSLMVLLYNVYIKKNAPADYSLWKWLIIMIPLTIIFHRLYDKFQGKKSNQNKNSVNNDVCY